MTGFHFVSSWQSVQPVPRRPACGSLWQSTHAPNLSPVHFGGSKWHFAQATEVCAPRSWKRALSWSKPCRPAWLTSFQADSLWQLAHAVPKRPSCGSLWHEAQALERPRKVGAPRALERLWHLLHWVLCAPLRGHPVCA